LVVIEDGIQDGETVVTSGQFRLQPGSRVEAKPMAAAQAPTAKSE